MRRMTVTGFVLIACSYYSAPGLAQNVLRQTVSPDVSFVASSLQGPSRKIMRLSDGKIYLSLLSNPEAGAQIKLFAANDRKPSWEDVSGRELSAVKARSVNSDTGPSGTFVSFINGSSQAGEILLFPDPVGSPGRILRFSSLTRQSDQIADGYIAASKGDESTNSVAYGWRDIEKNTLLIGFSADGRQFPEARPVVTDSFLRSGPLLAIHNKYVLVSYLSADPRFKPKAVNDSTEQGGAYPVFVESWDGAQTWSAPRPVLGTDPAQFPKVDYAQIGAKATDINGNLLAIGGSEHPSNALAWPQAGIGARIFVLSEQHVVSSDATINTGLRSNPVNVAVLAFKDLSDGPQAPWNTVIASVPPPAGQKVGDVPGADDFQYSALPGTSIRAVAYRRSPTRQQTRNAEGVVVSISINTGQSFDRSVFVPKERLGLGDRDPVIFTSSTCVYKNDKGDLFLDIAYVDTANKVQTAQLPLEFNLSQLPPSMFNVVAKWP